MSEFNVYESIKAQAKYCEETKSPHFAPQNGVCWNCRKNIYEQHEKEGYQGRKWITGITTEKASSELVTGCPHCNRSYCD